MSNDVIIEIVRLVIGSIHDHGKWAGEEIEGLRFDKEQLEQEVEYLKGQVDSLKVENAALQKKVKKLQGDADGD